jgi:hypothetical protein
MFQDKRRACPRDIYQAPILISEKLDGIFSHAIMQNHSTNGMYLVCQQALDFDMGIYINMLEKGKRDPYKGFFGRVKWCRELKRSEDVDDHFGVGINLIVKSHIYFGGIGCMVDCCCDVCGEKIPIDQMIRTDDFVIQCKDCHQSLQNFPEGNLKSSINKYLLGNIL